MAWLMILEGVAAGAWLGVKTSRLSNDSAQYSDRRRRDGIGRILGPDNTVPIGPSRLLKNPLAAPCGVGNGLKMLIYSPSTLRFFAHFRLAWYPPEDFSTAC
jgi:hypothetical protein